MLVDQKPPRLALLHLPTMTNQQTHELTPAAWLAARRAKAASPLFTLRQSPVACLRGAGPDAFGKRHAAPVSGATTRAALPSPKALGSETTLNSEIADICATATAKT